MSKEFGFQILDGDYDKLVDFFVENQLEFDGDEEVDTSIVKTYKIDDEQGEILAGAVLAKREDRFIVDGIAVDEKFRKEGIGEYILNKLLSDAKDLGGDSVYLVARAPGFFKTQGFAAIDPANAPNFFECKTCPQYGITCHPEVMKIDL